MKREAKEGEEQQRLIREKNLAGEKLFKILTEESGRHLQQQEQEEEEAEAEAEAEGEVEHEAEAEEEYRVSRHIYMGKISRLLKSIGVIIYNSNRQSFMKIKFKDIR